LPKGSEEKVVKLSLFLTFFRIGWVGFGGLGSVLALVEQELVNKRQALTPSDITEALTYTKLLPGSTVVQVVSYLGWRLGGWGGSAAATIAFIVPSFIVMLVLSVIYSQITALPNVQSALRGLNAAVVGLLVITCYRLGLSTVKNFMGFVLAVAALALAVIARFPLVSIVIGAGALGVVAYAIERGRGK
jgi:chromate transporter